MNNEPVAWMGKDYDGLKTDLYFDVEKNKLPYRLYESAIPLYTHPVKELTDEEAFEIFADEAMKGGNYDWKAGVRAILRKASEKCNHSNFVKTEHLTGEGAMEYVEWFDNVCSDCGEHWTTNN